MTGPNHATARRDRARASRERLLPRITKSAEAALPDHEADALVARASRRWFDIYEALDDVYGGVHDVADLMSALLDLVVEAAAVRPDALRRQDRRREIAPDWHQREELLGYVCYVDRFAGTLDQVAGHVDYLVELGVNYLHLMPLLAPRPDPNDGGYAVADYRRVDPRLGTMADLGLLAATLREHGISLCIDLVVNHTAREHPWARAAAAGDPHYRDYYHVFDDRREPDAFERTLADVFPDTAPGSFTWDDEVHGWVWTTFHDYQWDLNYANPAVFTEMLEIMCFLANRGVDVLRLDAVPFMWKRLGTDCQNADEVHALLQAFRGLVGIAAPALVFKAEAIVEPGQLVKYLGTHGDRHRPECDLAYHNQLMVMSWSALAERNTQLAAQALSRMRMPPTTTAWCTYVRGHDDIGWAVTDEDAAAVGLDGPAHRDFLNRFYSGDFPQSFARGERFQHDAETGDARISGMAASLCGIEQALDAGDEDMLDLAIRRLLLLYGVAMSYGGTPLLYMGDELALRNDRTYLDDPVRADDNRWMHRPPMDWEAAGRRHDASTFEGRVFAGLAHLARTRAALPPLRGGGATRPQQTDNPAVLAYLRSHPRTGKLLVIANFADTEQTCDAEVLHAVARDACLDALAPEEPVRRHGRVHLPRLGLRWITAD